MSVDEEGVEEAAMVESVFAQLQGVFVRESPANIVVGPNIVDPCAVA